MWWTAHDAPVAHADVLTGQSISVTSGTATTPFALALSAPNNTCQGDTATGGYRWHMYFATDRVDLDTIEVSAGRLTTPTETYPYVDSLYATTGAAQVNRATAINTGQIVGTSIVNLATNQVQGDGLYRIGYLCTLAGVATRRWTTTLLVRDFVDRTNFSWSLCLCDRRPTVTIDEWASADGTTVAGTVTPVAAPPNFTSYVVELREPSSLPTPPLARQVLGATGGSFQLSGLTTGTDYVVTAYGLSTAGSSSPSTPVGVRPFRLVPSPLDFLRVNGSDGLIVTTWFSPFNPPPTNSTYAPPTALRIDVQPPIAGAPFVLSRPFDNPSPIGFPPYGFVIASPPGARTVTLTVDYPSPFPSSTFTFDVTVTGAGPTGGIVVQDIATVRPRGALVITQRCGVFGSAATYSDDVFGTLPALPATAGADPSGASPPSAVGTAPTRGAGGVPDPQFTQYPYPVDSAGDALSLPATNCAVDLGTAALIVAGPRAGQYFKATGRIAQLTVVDTRDSDSGWTFNGTMSPFVSSTDPTDTFSGDLLGWDPEVTWDTGPTLDLYDMSVAAGNPRQPVPNGSPDGLGSPTQGSNPTRARSLAQAQSGRGLGQAVMDARLRLLVPTTADAGTYVGVLTFTIV